jgi:TrmH family RNA methyltransferase
MSNFGFFDMRLVNAYDLAYREAKSAVKSQYILEQAQTYSSLAEAVAECSLVVGTTAVGHRDLHIPLYRLETGARLIREHLTSAKAALLFGSEKFGLSNDDISRCHWLMRIPVRDEHASMNLGQAVAVCLYELKRDESAVNEPEYPSPAPASAESLERLTSVFLQLLVEGGYTQERTSESSELKLRRLMRRLRLPEHDAEIMLGMLRQVLWKIRNQ